LVYFGSGSFGLPTLRSLVAAKCVRLVVSQPDKPAGRGGALTPTPVSEFALQAGLPLLRPEDCNRPESVQEIRAALHGERMCFAVIAYGQKMGAQLLEGAFAINLHGSLLPRWRGAAPYQRAVMEGDTMAGVTVIGVAERMDAGDMYARADVPIGPSMTAGELHDQLSQMGPPVMLPVLCDWAEGRAKCEPQSEALATRARKLSRADAWAEFSATADAVRARINGLSPWPGCAVRVESHELKVLRAVCRNPDGVLGTPGEVLADGTVACGRGSVQLLEVQPPGGTCMAFDAWRRGRNLSTGALLVSGAVTPPSDGSA
jgi:methionyl-tRNA formyltransferase